LTIVVRGAAGVETLVVIICRLHVSRYS